MKRRQQKVQQSEPCKQPPPGGRLAWTALATVLALAAPLWPLAFLPRVLSVPLALLAAVLWWLPLVVERGWVRLPLGLVENIIEALGVGLVLASYLLLKLVGLHPSGTDDNIYFYMAHRMTEGALPYRDFFFAHPPVHLLIPALVFAISGFSIGVAKAIPALAQGLAGLFLYLAVRRTSRGLAVLVLLLHLTAYQVLMGSTDMNGENIMTAFLMASFLAVVSARPLLAGILAAFGLASGLYALAGVVALGILSFRKAGRFCLGLALAFVAICLPFAIAGGEGFFQGVFAYHLAKPVKGTDHLPVFESLNPFSMLRALFHNFGVYLRSDAFAKAIYWHAPQWVAALVGLLFILGRAIRAYFTEGSDSRLSLRELSANTESGLLKSGVLATVLFLFQWAALNEVYDFYLVPMLAFLAIPAGCGLLWIWRGFREARDPRGVLWPGILALCFSMHTTLAKSLSARLWPEEAESQGVVTYEWREPWALSGLSGLTRALFFEDRRIKGEVTPYYRHYVWNKMLTFSTVDDIAAHVAASTDKEETITGASTLAPLVALYANRRLAADEADTNHKRFTSFTLTDEEFFKRVCADRVRYIVSAARSHFDDKFMRQDPVVTQDFRLEREFVDPQLLHFRGYPITLWRRVDNPSRCRPP